MNKEKGIIIFGIFLLVIVWFYRYSPIVYTTKLNWAIISNDQLKVEKLLKQGGDINRHNSLRIVEDVGNTPLKQACIQGNIEIIQMLLDHGAKVNTEEWTPLTLALTNEYSDQYEVVKLLIEHRANLNGKEKAPIFMLLSGKYDVSMGAMGMFGRKDRAKHEEMYRIFILLVESGASLEHWEDAKRYQLSYPDLIFYCTVLQGNMQILEYLIEEQFEINNRLIRGRTALMVAIENDDRVMVEYLLSKGADQTIANDEGKTAWDIAEEKGNEEIMQLLK